MKNEQDLDVSEAKLQSNPLKLYAEQSWSIQCGLRITFFSFLHTNTGA